MLNRKMLEEMGLEKEQIDKIMKAHGKGIEGFKADIAKKDEEIESLAKQVEDANEQISEFEKEGLDIEEVQKQVKEYKEKFEAAKKEREELEYNYNLKEALKEYQPHDVNDLLLFIDKDDVVYKDGKFVNLDQIMDEVKESKPYWFKEEEQESESKPKFSGPSGNTRSTEITVEEFNNMGYFDRVKLKSEDENLYNELMKGER